jgi:hypothetical protein
VSAVGTGSGNQIRPPVEQQGRAGFLRPGRKRLDVRQQRALVGLRQPQQHGGNIAGGECYGQILRQPARVSGKRCDKVEPGRQTPRFGRFSLGRHGRSIAPAIGR